ncbi:MAG: hypothetical protein JRS35_18560 [Deltaproteobacteria bacterium]|nr:hypothetical protein [Deltaproteobacteria bacterium]
MKRQDFEHVVRASGAIAADDELVVIGSQAVHGQFPELPASLTISADLNVYPKNCPEKAANIDGAIGELSMFHESYGYYAQGVSPETAILPTGWESRLIRYASPATGGVTALCLEVHDLAIAKLVAGRRKDIDFCTELVRHEMIDHGAMTDRLALTALDTERRELVKGRISRIFTDTRRE